MNIFKRKKKVIKINNLKYSIKAIKYVLYEERKYKSNIKFTNKLKCLLNGFTSEKYYLYDFKDDSISRYLSDFQRRKTQKINGKYSILLDDKKLFERVLASEKVVPVTFARISDGNIILNNEKASVNDLLNLIKQEKIIIIKKNIGGGGKGIYRVEITKDGLLLNNKPTSELDFNNF